MYNLPVVYLKRGLNSPNLYNEPTFVQCSTKTLASYISNLSTYIRLESRLRERVMLILTCDEISIMLWLSHIDRLLLPKAAIKWLSTRSFAGMAAARDVARTCFAASVLILTSFQHATNTLAHFTLGQICLVALLVWTCRQGYLVSHARTDKAIATESPAGLFSYESFWAVILISPNMAITFYKTQ